MKSIKFVAFFLLAACAEQSAVSIDTTPSETAAPVPSDEALAACQNQPPADDIGAFQCSWEHRALTHQRRLGFSLPLREAQIFSSHNSYNSSAYPGLSSSDLNQTRSLLEQFQLGVRSFELDVHWIFHAQTGDFAPVTCHGLSASQEHSGCTSLDRHLNESLDEIASFLESDQGQGQVLFLDLEDHLSPAPISGAGTSSEAAHASALSTIIAKIGKYIYQPAQNTGCQSTPMSLTQAEILAAGKNIILNAPCEHADWGNWAFEVDSVRPGQKAHTGFTGYPDCDSTDFSFEQYRQRWVREWEDTTQVGASTNPSLQRMSDQNLQDMAHCGVNFASLDRVDPKPPNIGAGNPAYLGQGINFSALVWSWAEDKPSLNNSLECAYLSTADGRFHDASCEESRAYACMRSGALQAAIESAAGLWVIHAQGEHQQAHCPADYHFSRPENAWLKQQLLETLEAAGLNEVWIDYRETSLNTWQ